MLNVTQLVGFGASAEAPAGAIWSAIDKTASVTLSNGNKDATGTGSANQCVRSATIVANNSGKYWCEVHWTNTGSVMDAVSACGIDDAANPFHQFANVTATPADSYMFRDEGVIINASSATGGFTNWDQESAVIQIAFDTTAGAGKIWWAVGENWEGGGNPAAGTGAQYSSISNVSSWAVVAGTYGAAPEVLAARLRSALGETVYTPPSGFARL